MEKLKMKIRKSGLLPTLQKIWGSKKLRMKIKKIKKKMINLMIQKNNKKKRKRQMKREKRKKMRAKIMIKSKENNSSNNSNKMEINKIKILLRVNLETSIRKGIIEFM